MLEGGMHQDSTLQPFVESQQNAPASDAALLSERRLTQVHESEGGPAPKPDRLFRTFPSPVP
jgi:hypothetical protein